MIDKERNVYRENTLIFYLTARAYFRNTFFCSILLAGTLKRKKLVTGLFLVNLLYTERRSDFPVELRCTDFRFDLSKITEVRDGENCKIESVIKARVSHYKNQFQLISETTILKFRALS